MKTITCSVILISLLISNLPYAQTPHLEVEGNAKITGHLDLTTDDLDPTSITIGRNAGDSLVHSVIGHNTFIGYFAGNRNTFGEDNAFYGYATGSNNSSGSWNTFMGSSAGLTNLTSSNNSYFGYFSGRNSTGSENTFIGSFSGIGNVSGSNNTMLGYSANVLYDSLERAIAIGNYAKVGCNDCAVLGGVGSSAVKLGIGTEVPLENVHIHEGTSQLPSFLKFSNISTGENGGFNIGLSDGGQAQLKQLGANGMIFQSNNKVGLAINGDAMVGIGTAVPLSKLHVHEEDSFLPNFLKFSNLSTGPAGGFDIGISDGGQAQLKQLGGNGMIFQSNNKVGLAINGQARVGVGTAVPLTKLHLHEDQPATSNIIKLTTEASGNSSTSGLSLGISDVGNAFLQLYENQDLSFLTNNATRMTITSDGNLGIGTNTPVEKLEVIGNILAYGNFMRINDGSQVALIHTNPAQNYIRLDVGGTGHSTDNIIIGDPISAVNKVGIGTSSPEALLHVNADVVKKINGGSWTASSDRRLKKDITEYQEGLEEVLRIHPVRFKYNELSGHKDDKEYIGVIAQELEKIAPHMVSSFKTDQGTFMQVDNSAMIYMMINAIKEQQKEINELRRRMATLDSNLD